MPQESRISAEFSTADTGPRLASAATHCGGGRRDHHRQTEFDDQRRMDAISIVWRPHWAELKADRIAQSQPYLETALGAVAVWQALKIEVGMADLLRVARPIGSAFLATCIITKASTSVSRQI